MHTISALFILVSLSGVPTPAREDPVRFDWLRFGREQRVLMPSELKRATRLMQVHYLAEQTADKLWTLGIPPNHNQAGRDRAQRTFQDAGLGTCGHTARCLQQVWLGAGIPDSAMAIAVVLKRRANGQIPDELNADHAAMVYLHPDGPVVFDLWCHGRAGQTFVHFRSSTWRGIPLGEWGRRMAQEGYTVAAFQQHPELGEATPYEFAELVRRLSCRQAGATTGNRSGKTGAALRK
jgi:hypothetical protein